MKIASNYPDDVVGVCLTLERKALDAWAHRDWARSGLGDLLTDTERADIEHAAARAEMAHRMSLAVYPGATLCDHGLSLDLCADPINHYPPDH